ncbi:hypothetical protein BC832DRAFT_531415 [Gaertneriomyces semiglobifer]|nr:hypothetical protein BC832DRAFT_531415 [Gaertneriomyces semiglobifer]
MSKILGVLPTNVDNSKEDETLSAGSNPLSTIPVPESLTPVPPFPADELLNARHPDLVIIPYKDLTLSLFQKHWRARKAIMVTGMADRVTEDWEPQVFAEIAGMEEAGIVNCETDMVTPEMKLSDFFGGFGRIRPKKGPVEKLKDWPTDSHFRDKLPHQHAKFLELIPVPEYTHPTGSFNMAGHIAESDVPPDLGPKMYAAYGYRPNTTGGTTKLHLDVADAANVMVWTKGHWENGQDGKDYSTHRLSGAIWDLFPPHSLTTLRNYLRQDYADVSKKIHKKFPEKIDDPIHDQTFFLHPAHLVDLQRRHGVTPIRVHQAVGDAIFVPAGFAHQVSNYGDSIKCALDFVSSEGIGVCETLCGEFRKLKKGHGRRGDTLCVAKVVWGVVRSAMLEAGSKQDGEPTATQVPEDVAESVPLSDTPAPTVA